MDEEVVEMMQIESKAKNERRKQSVTFSERFESQDDSTEDDRRYSRPRMSIFSQASSVSVHPGFKYIFLTMMFISILVIGLIFWFLVTRIRNYWP